MIVPIRTRQSYSSTLQRPRFANSASNVTRAAHRGASIRGANIAKIRGK
jgi:hypothetical protein